MNDLSAARALLIYLEPTDYVLGLIARLRAAWPGPIEVWFVGRDLSQAWNLSLDDPDMTLLPQSYRSAVRYLLRELRAGRFSLVHLAGWGHSVLLTAMLLAWLRGIPVAVESDTHLTPTALTWQRRAKRLLHPMLFRLPAVFLPGGQRQAVYLRHYGVEASRIRIAQMTVDVTAIRRHRAGIRVAERLRLRERFGLSKRAVVFLYVGRLEPCKGVTDLLDAFGELCIQPRDATLLMVGDGSLRELVAMAARSQPGIRAVGRLQGLDLLDAYAVADVLVLPSHFEPWGLVVNEAMAAGLPVIITDRVGCGDDLVAPGKNGLVVKAEDPQALSAAMERLAEDADLRWRMGQEAWDMIAGWTLENEAGRVVEAWRGLLPS